MSAPVALPHMNPVSRFLRHKKWIYSFVATPEIIALGAIADLGYASNAFFLVADRRARSILIDRGFAGLPRPFAHVNDFPADGMRAHFRLPGLRVEARGEAGAYHQRVQASGMLWLGELATQGAPPLTLTAPVPGGGANFTQKWAALEARGQLEVGSLSFDLKGGVGGVDYTNGLLARHTAWRWAFACGRLDDGTRVGLNLTHGFNEAPGISENALFVGDQLLPLGRAHFSWNKNHPLAPWHCSTQDGDTAVDLAFEPIGAHREARDWRIVRSRFVQPVGHFSGTLKVRGRVHHVKDLAGVTEDQDIVW